MRTWILIFLAGVLAAQTRVDSTPWHKIRGANYIPSYGRNSFEIWSAYNHDSFDSELRLARGVGYNSVRLWLSYSAFEARGAKMADDVADAVALCRKHGLKALVVLFDGCGVRPRRNPRWMPVSEAYRYFTTDPRFTPTLRKVSEANYRAYAEGPGRDILVPVAEDSPPHVMLWQHWRAEPGYDKLSKNHWPRIDGYLRAVVGRLAGNPAILAWDIMNEPEFAAEEPFESGLNKPEVRERVTGFLEHVRSFLKKHYPGEVLTLGFAGIENTFAYDKLADVLTFHFYSDDPAKLKAAIDQASAFAAKVRKPIFNTETIANFRFGPYDVEHLATDEGQLAHYRKVIPAWVDAPIGWMAWGLVVGRIFDPYCDIFYANGHPRPAARYLAGQLKGKVESLW